MNLKFGDNVSGENISAGKYLGKGEIDAKEFHKIYDSQKKITLYIPLGKENEFRKLPTEKIVLENIKMFELNNFIDSQEIDGSRYKYYKEKLTRVSFKGTLEVLHDLKVLHQRKMLSLTEKNLLQILKEKMVTEISFVLNCEPGKAENMLLLNVSRA